MSAELPDALQHLSWYGAGTITRKGKEDEAAPTLPGDFLGYLSRFGEFTNTTLDDLVAALGAFTDVGNMAVSYRVQRNVTILAVIALAAAILALDPHHVMDWVRFLRSAPWLRWFN